jgi:phthalate 4,5-cis-dihydrodiol dehydrogenase
VTGPLRVGLAGLGSASWQILPSFAEVPGVTLAGAADVRADARAAFTKTHDRPAFSTVAELCRSPEVDAVWIATPNLQHCEHAVAAADAGKHVICEKPMAVTLAECDRMVEAAARAGVQLIQGHSKIFDAPVRAMRQVIESGRLGKVIQIEAINHNDWLQRPRLASELETRQGGGLVFRQGPHMVDIVRYLAGGRARSVRAVAGRRDPHFDTEGNFSALLLFEDGIAATLGFNGYGYFDVTELTWGIGELGAQHADPRRKPRGPRRAAPVEPATKYDYAAKPPKGSVYDTGDHPPFFGLVIVSCERGAIRQSPEGLYLYTDAGCEEVALPRNTGRAAELIELRDALSTGRAAFPDGRWGRATLETCLAILESSRSDREVRLLHQVPAP